MKNDEVFYAVYQFYDSSKEYIMYFVILRNS